MAQVHFKEKAHPAVVELTDGTKIIRTCAAGFGCHNLGCGLRVFVKDGTIQKIEGDPEHPISKGRLCIRCLTAKEYFNHPDRLLYPLKRLGERGSNEWERISWDEALGTIIENFKKVRDTYGINSTSVWCGTGREASKYHFQTCNDVFGTITAVHPNSGWSCIVPRMASMFWCMGSSYIEFDNAIGSLDRYDDPEWECPKYMLMWGRDPLRSNPDGLWGHSVIEMMKRGMKLIVVDPRANWLATRAEHHLQLRPGTDGALALALLSVVIEEDLVDHEFIDRWCYGYDELAERAKEYSPERVAKICGLDAEDIVAAARCLASGRATMCMGLAVDQNPNCIQIGHALLSLFAILGNMDVPGGLFMGQPSTFGADVNVVGNADEPIEGGLEGLELYGNVGINPLGHDKYPAMSLISNNTHPDYTLDVLETEQPYPIKFAYMFAHNPLACMVEQPKRWFEALRKIDFIAMADQFMTPSIIGLADIVLPASTYLEHAGFVSNNNSSQPGQLGSITKVVDNLGETRSDLEIMLEFHKRLYPQSKRTEWANPETYLTNELSRINGVDFTYPELKDKVIGLYELEYKKYEKGLLRGDGQVGFSTPTGRIELYSNVLSSVGEDPLPYYIEPLFSAESRPDLVEEYPLTLTTGARRFTSFHSENRSIKTLREIHPWQTLEIHPLTAASRGITEGSWVWIENPWGKVKACAHLTSIVKEEVVSCDHGWWYPERSANTMFDIWETSMNQLLPHEENGPLGFGSHYKSLPCTVYRAE